MPPPHARAHCVRGRRAHPPGMDADDDTRCPRMATLPPDSTASPTRPALARLVGSVPSPAAVAAHPALGLDWPVQHAPASFSSALRPPRATAPRGHAFAPTYRGLSALRAATASGRLAPAPTAAAALAPRSATAPGDVGDEACARAAALGHAAPHQPGGRRGGARAGGPGAPGGRTPGGAGIGAGVLAVPRVCVARHKGVHAMRLVLEAAGVQ